MGIVLACITPHGSEAIPQLAGDKMKAFAQTTLGMEKIALTMKEHKIDTIIIATPHNLRLKGNIGVITTESAEGALEDHNGSIRIRVQCNKSLAEEILHAGETSKLPVVGVNYGTNEGPASCMPMDWGTLIPLWFFKHQLQNPRAVIITPSREIPMEKLVEFGSLIAQTAAKSDTKIAFVASADQAHTHKAKGPYGFHPRSTEFDGLVQKAVEQDDLRMLLDLDPQLIEDAKPDSIWQMAILVGVLENTPMKSKLISYQAPTYFGLLCATYLPR